MSESIIDKYSDNTKSDFVNVTGNIIQDINYKLVLFMFIFGMFIFSDIFIDGFLSKFNNTVQGECTTNKGSIIQLTIYCTLLLILDLVIKWKFI